MVRILLKLLSVFLLIFFLLLLKLAYRYFNENKLYSHYVLKSLLEQYRFSIVEGYTDKFSYHHLDSQFVFLHPRNPGQQWVKLYDIKGNRIDSVFAHLQFQKRANDAGENDFGFKVSFTYNLQKLSAGVYLWENSVPFLIRGNGKIKVLYPSNTINAYNVAGGKSLYKIFSHKTEKVSFRRPTFPAISFHVSAVLKWLYSQNQYRFSYLSDYDLDDFSSLSDTELLIVIGHNEYWSRKARENFDNYVANGGNAIILSGNTMWWQVRYGDNGNTLICYKDEGDPIEDKALKTVNWVDPDLSYPVLNSIGSDFVLGGFGRKSKENKGGYRILLPMSPILNGAGLKEKDILNVSTKEYDGTYLIRKGNKIEIDKNKLGFYKAELIGLDHTVNDFGVGNGAFILFQKNVDSGVIINTGTADWCSDNGIGGPDSTKIKRITLNMIDGLIQKKNLFSHQ